MRMSKSLDRKELIKRLEEDRNIVNGRLEELLPPSATVPESLHRAMRYSVLGEAKRIRAVLCLESSRIWDGDSFESALDAACAIEFIHAYTLIHDDLPALDNDSYRRGKFSCHVEFGEALAILTGDALQALAFQVLSCCSSDKGKAVRAVEILARNAGSTKLVGGQVMDIENEGSRPDPHLVSGMHRRKTGELISASMAIGAVIAGADAEGWKEFRNIGMDVGLAFQIIDDILDIEGKKEIVGKGVGGDDSRRKVTYPATFGLDRSRKMAKQLIEKSMERVEQYPCDGYIQGLFRLIVNRIK